MVNIFHAHLQREKILTLFPRRTFWCLDIYCSVHRNILWNNQQMSQCAGKFYFSASPLYMFRAAHTPSIRSTILTVSTAIGTIHSRSQIVSVTSSQRSLARRSREVLFLCKSTLHVSGGTHAHHQEYNLNCINSHWYNS